ncbi:MAG: 2-amino-4-hydroxy-6-hydroxymethyldihydropteridine diphosphokinase [Magnetococcales bacterium]|nr:2-amino-4-hydroxy-6-hydroxymethyldihydropteridine diphosphokinase [Magnetococcales bacterium]
MSGPVLIAFGANIDPLNNLLQGLSHLHRAIELQAISTVWKTDPLPDPKQQEAYDMGGGYLNGAVLSHTQIDPFSLRKILKKIESECHRVRSPNRFAPRSLDLDIALMGSRVMTGPEMVLPDPDIVSRSFVALPLAQLMPDMVHPVEKKSLSVLAASFLPLDRGMVEDREATKMLQSLIGR